MLGHSEIKFSLFPTLPLNLSFCAEPKAKSQNPSTNKEPSPSWKGGPSQMLYENRAKALFRYPSSALTATFSPGRWISYALITLDSATPGKPCVQNDTRVRWEWKKNPVLFMSAAKNYIRKSTFVQYSTDESIKNYFTQYQSKAKTLNINQ